jgi:hypothetical protein
MSIGSRKGNRGAEGMVLLVKTYIKPVDALMHHEGVMSEVVRRKMKSTMMRGISRTKVDGTANACRRIQSPRPQQTLQSVQPPPIAMVVCLWHTSSPSHTTNSRETLLHTSCDESVTRAIMLSSLSLSLCVCVCLVVYLEEIRCFG